MTQTVGIDLGTTNSAVARIVGKNPVVLSTANGDRTIPSVVSFDPDSETVQVGQRAVNLNLQHPDRVIESVKRRMGESEPIAHLNGSDYLPEEISALILEEIKNVAKENLGSPITNAVITVPAYFSNQEREATKRAGQIAGLNVDRIINEPTAAMLSHGNRRNDNMVALVYDLGGGTFDVSVVKAADGIFEVVATDGLSHHGGDDWDACLAGQIKQIVEKEVNQSIEENSQVMQRIWEAARDAKHELSNRSKTTVRLPFIVDDWTFEEALTRKEFEEMTSELLEETIDVCNAVLTDAGMETADIDEVLLVGGSTRMPQVEDRLRDIFGDKVQRSGSPDEVVAKGAAIQAGIIQESLPTIKESGSDTLQAQESEILGNHKDSHYDLPEVYDDVVLVDVTSESLGTKTVGDNYIKLVRQNTSIPAERTERFITTEDEQTLIKVGVFQGESMTASENTQLDEFVFSGLPRLPAGEAKIDVTFRINENGILEVRAESVQRGHSDSITIDSGIEFGEREIEQMQSALPEIQ